jgi:hypothetical protein
VEESVMLSETPVYELSIEGENMAVPIRLKAFRADTTNVFAISSSLNTGTFFSGKKTGLFDKAIKKKEYFFPTEGTENKE